MCLAIPGKLLDSKEQDGTRVGRVQFGGIVRQVCLDFVPEAAVGDYVIVHVGFAISRVDTEEVASDDSNKNLDQRDRDTNTN